MFNQKSNVIQDFISFATFRSVIGQNSRLPLNQSDANLRPISFWSPAFSRAYSQLHKYVF